MESQMTSNNILRWKVLTIPIDRKCSEAFSFVANWENSELVRLLLSISLPYGIKSSPTWHTQALMAFALNERSCNTVPLSLFVTTRVWKLLSNLLQTALNDREKPYFYDKIKKKREK
jgi:hypothetical protein